MSSGANPGGPIVQWVNNDNTDATPPADADDWIATIRSVSRIVRVVLVSRPGARWHLDTAEQLQVSVGHGPFPTSPIDLKDSVRAALLARGKPLVE